MQNLFGTPLEKCKLMNDDNSGSWDMDGYCSDRNYDTGVHQICLKMNNERTDFSKDTYQSDWSRSREGNNHCVCVGAYSLWKSKQAKEGSTSDDDVVCHAIPATAIVKHFDAWKKWNGHEEKYDLDETFRIGMQSLYQQCEKQARDENEKTFLKNFFMKSGIHR